MENADKLKSRLHSRVHNKLHFLQRKGLEDVVTTAVSNTITNASDLSLHSPIALQFSTRNIRYSSQSKRHIQNSIEFNIDIIQNLQEKPN